MSEGFDVRESAVAGYGVLCEEIHHQLVTEFSFIGAHAGAQEGFRGVLAVLKGPVDAYAAAACSRLSRHASVLDHTSTELKRTAWAYTGADESAYKRFGGDPGQPTTSYQDFPNPDHYRVTDPTGALTPPDISAPDIAAKVDEVGGALNVIDDVVSFVTGWSPVAAIVEPISGNWNALDAAGGALVDAGNALDESLANLTGGLKQLDSKWDGGASQAFDSYMAKLVEGTDQEAPLNRIVGQVYQVAAAQVEKVADFVVSKLKWAVDLIGERLKTAWIPFYGQYKAIRAVEECIDVFNEAKAMVETLEKVINRVLSIIEFAKDPIGRTQDAAEGWLEDKLAPIRHRVAQYEKGVEIGTDLAELSKVDDWTDTPTSGYQTGKNMRRPGEG